MLRTIADSDALKAAQERFRRRVEQASAEIMELCVAAGGTITGVSEYLTEEVGALAEEIAAVEDAGAEHVAVRAQNLPAVRVVVPALVGVADRHGEPVGALARGLDTNVDDIGLPRLRRRGEPEPEDQRGRRSCGRAWTYAPHGAVSLAVNPSGV